MTHLGDGSVVAVFPAAGSGQRFGAAKNKLFSSLAGEPLWLHSLRRIGSRREVGRVIVAVAARDLSDFRDQLAASNISLAVEFVIGGTERMDSVQIALDSVSEDSGVQWVAVHDAARPLVSDEDLDRIFSAVQETGAALLATPVSGTLKREMGEGNQIETVDRRRIWVALTPQVFRLGLLKLAYSKHNGCPATDDAQLVERLGHEVQLVHGSADNLKITFPEDLSIAEAILSRNQ